MLIILFFSEMLYYSRNLSEFFVLWFNAAVLSNGIKGILKCKIYQNIFKQMLNNSFQFLANKVLHKKE